MIKFLGNKSLFEFDIKYTTETEILSCLKKCSIIGLDIETCRKYPKNQYKEDVYQPGLDPYVTKICMLQIGDLNNQFVIDVRTHSINFLKEILENESILKVGHNLKFEGKHILLGFNIFLVNVWDTMISERILYNGLGLKNTLAALSTRYLGIEEKPEYDLFENNNNIEDLEEEIEFDDLKSLDYEEKIYIDKSIRTNFINIGDRPFTLEEINYGVNDIIYPLMIYPLQKVGRKVGEELYNPVNGFNLENKFTQTLAKIELRGIKVDQEGWKNLYEDNKKIYIKKIESLNNWVSDFHPKFANQMDLFNPKPTCSIDWKSPKEVIKFAKYLGICPKEKSKFTGRMEYSVGAVAMYKLLTNENKDRFMKMKELSFNDKDDTQAFILNFLITKKYQQLTTTFGLDWLRFIHPITGRIHTNFIQLMNTGRMGSTSPNLQQVPSSKLFRQLFVSNQDTSLIATDFDSQEARLAAQVTKVPLLLDFFINGHPIFKDDFHSFTATQMYRVLRKDPELLISKEKYPKERVTAKSMTFKLFFGGSEFTVAQDLGVDLQAGTDFYNSYFNGFPGLRENFEETKKLAVKRGWVELDSFTKKRFFFKNFERMKEVYTKAQSYYPEGYMYFTKEEKEKTKKKLKIESPELSLLWKEYMIYKGKLERAGLNYRIQGSAASMSKIATLLIDKDNLSLTEGVLLIIHDEIVEEYKKEKCSEKSEFTKQCFKKSGTFICKDVPMSGTSEIGTYWIH